MKSRIKQHTLNDTALILIDVQKGFDDPQWGRRNNPEAERQMTRLLQAFRGTDRKVIHVQHMSAVPGSPLYPGQTGNDIKPMVRPGDGETLIRKTVNSAFIGTELEAMLRADKIRNVVIVGLITIYCVSTTARMAANLGFETIVVSDATATFDHVGLDGEAIPAETMHRTALAELKGEFARVLTTEEVLACSPVRRSLKLKKA